jgi:hypothetical protein
VSGAQTAQRPHEPVQGKLDRRRNLMRWGYIREHAPRLIAAYIENHGVPPSEHTRNAYYTELGKVFDETGAL